MATEPERRELHVSENMIAPTLLAAPTAEQLPTWSRSLLWGFSPALELEFQKEGLHSRRKHAWFMSTAILMDLIFALSGTLVIFRTSLGFYSRCIWCWLLVEHVLLYLTSAGLSKQRCRLAAKQQSQRFLSRQLVVLIAWRIHSLCLTLAFNVWVSPEVNFKEGWFNLIQTVSTTSSAAFFWIVGLRFRIPFLVHWRLEVVQFAILAVASPKFCIHCSSDLEDRFVIVSEAIGNSISACLTLGSWPLTLIPGRKAACFAVSYFLMAGIGALPSVVLGIEEAKLRIDFLVRRLPPSQRGLWYLDQYVSIALLPKFIIMIFPPYIALVWVLAVHAAAWAA